MPAGDAIEDGGLQFAEAGLPLAGKQLGNRPAGGLFQGVVGIDEAIAEGLSQGTPHRTFAGTHHPHQVDIEARQPLAQGGRF